MLTKTTDSLFPGCLWMREEIKRIHICQTERDKGERWRREKRLHERKRQRKLLINQIIILCFMWWVLSFLNIWFNCTLLLILLQWSYCWQKDRKKGSERKMHELSEWQGGRWIKIEGRYWERIRLADSLSVFMYVWFSLMDPSGPQREAPGWSEF